MQIFSFAGRNNSIAGNIANQYPFFQAKLSINQPNDVYEQEANNVADAVSKQSHVNINSFFSPPLIQRKISNANKPGAAPVATNNLSGGKPLSNSDQQFFKASMGYDFSNVRIHTTTAANQSAKNINALAYTTGNNIVFADNQYQPDTTEGKKLMAHELTHVVQQNSELNSEQVIQRALDKDPSELSDEQLQSEYDAYNEYIYGLQPEEYAAAEDSMEYFNALEKELKRRCLKSSPSHPTEVSQKLIDRITGKYAKVDGDPGEGLFQTPYVASEGQCTIGYGHVIFPKNSCTINTETTDDGKTKKTCDCVPPWNAISKDRAIELLKQDMRTHISEVDNKIKVDLNQLNLMQWLTFLHMWEACLRTL